MLSLPLAYVRPGMAVAKPVYSPRGDLLLNKGVEVQDFMIGYLLDRGFDRLWVKDNDTDDIEIREVISSRVHAEATAAIARIFDAIEMAIGDMPRDLENAQAIIRDPEFKRRFLESPELNELASVAEEVVGEALEGDLLSGLQTLRSHDDYTFAHCIDVAICSVLIGKELRLSKENLHILARGGMIDDLGKVFVGSAVLNKPSSLNAQELELMRAHPTLGYDMLRDASDVDLPIKARGSSTSRAPGWDGLPTRAQGNEPCLEEQVRAGRQHRPDG